MAGSRPQTAAQKRSDVALFKEFESAAEQDVKELAQKFTCDAVRTLVKLMKGTKTPPGVKRQCAIDILNQAWGRPDSRNDSDIVSKGLVINIVKLASGTVETIEAVDVVDISEAIDVAEMIVDAKAIGP